MEKRNLQKTGGASLTVTLPKKWLGSHNLKEKDTVFISFRDEGSLTIRPEYLMKKREKRTFKIDKLTLVEIQREIIAYYILGAEEIKIVGKTINKEQRLQIRKTLQMLVGFEIIEEDSQEVMLSNVLNTDKLSFQQGVSTMLSIAKSMYKDAVTSFLENNQDLAKDVVERDFEVDKLYFLIMRKEHLLFQRRVSEETEGVSLERANYYEEVANQLERIADHATKIAGISSLKKFNLQPGFKSNLEKVAQESLHVLDELTNFIQDIEKDKVHKLLAKINKEQKAVMDLYKKIDKSCTSEALIVCDSLSRLNGYLSNIAEGALNQALLEK